MHTFSIRSVVPERPDARTKVGAQLENCSGQKVFHEGKFIYRGAIHAPLPPTWLRPELIFLIFEVNNIRCFRAGPRKQLEDRLWRLQAVDQHRKAERMKATGTSQTGSLPAGIV